MVVFTCNNCGDSLQKPKVDKHINIECKKKFMNPSLCCVDCLKDFNRTSYNEHTKCVTELERYSAKGFVPKPSSNKGERKQQSWLEVIQAVLKKPNLGKQQRSLLESLSGVSNVPRKKPKFRNFVEMSLKHLKAPFAVIDEVFELIGTEFRSTIATNTSNPEPQKNNSIKQNSDVIQSEDESQKKNKKTQNAESKNIAVDTQNGNTKATEVLDKSGAFEVVKKKKKSKKEKTDNKNQLTENGKSQPNEKLNQNGKRPLEDDFEEEILAKSISKKKQKKFKFQELPGNSLNDSSAIDAQNSTESEPVLDTSAASAENVTANETETPKKLNRKERREMKRKQKLQQENQAVEPELNGTVSEPPATENTEENSEKVGKKEKKKKQKSQDLQETEISTEAETELNVTVPEITALTSAAGVSENVDIPSENVNYEKLTKKERKELKKKLKYEAELKAVASEVKPEDNEFASNDQENKDSNQKPEKKKKRKLTDSNENEEVANKKSKITEPEAIVEEIKPVENAKFIWDDVIKTVLEKAEGNEISLKRLSKKVVVEYMSYHPNEKSYEDIVKKFNKKIVKLPFVKVLKDKAKLCV